MSELVERHQLTEPYQFYFSKLGENWNEGGWVRIDYQKWLVIVIERINAEIARARNIQSVEAN